MTQNPPNDTDREVARIEALLDLATKAVREDDFGAAMMILEETLKSAERLPQKPSA